MLAEAVGQYSYGTAKNFDGIAAVRSRRTKTPRHCCTPRHTSRAAADPRNAGVIAWCGYDYASPMNAYNGVKCPGVVDTFRIPKLGASFYMAQVDPKKCVILEPSFYWDARLHAASGKAAVFSNCEELRIFLDDQPHDVRKPNRADFPNIPYPPFMIELPWSQSENAILRIDGSIAGRKAISRSLEGSRSNDRLWIKTDIPRSSQMESTRHASLSASRISLGTRGRLRMARLRSHLKVPEELLETVSSTSATLAQLARSGSKAKPAELGRSLSPLLTLDSTILLGPKFTCPRKVVEQTTKQPEVSTIVPKNFDSKWIGKGSEAEWSLAKKV